MLDQVFALEADGFGELAGRDLGVLTYAPGVVATEMQAEIRASSESDFPRRERFVRLHEEGQLVDAVQPARELVDWLETAPAGTFEERRFQPR